MYHLYIHYHHDDKLLVTIFHYSMLRARFEEQIKKSLDYFEVMRKKQLIRKKDKKEGWEATFLESETWTNLRMTCRGFFAYCRYAIRLGEEWAHLIPKFPAVSPAHSNTSIIEAWFSLVQKQRMDDAVNYPSFVGNRKMLKANKTLKNNNMYSEKDIGELTSGRIIGPRELIKFHQQRKEIPERQICEYLKKRLRNLRWERHQPFHSTTLQ